jgi:phage gpG-like protein
MSGISFNIDATRLRQTLERAGRAFDKRSLLRAIGLRHLGWVIKNFDAQGALVGGWRPLSKNTVAGRRGGSSSILQDTGRLKQSFDVERQNQDQVFDMAENSVTVGTRVIYASAHQEGVSASTMNPILPKTPRTENGVNAKGRKIFKGGVLRFMTPGGPVFVTAVRNHPGIPRRRMLPTVAQAEGLAVSVVDGAIAKVIRAQEARGG